jgi:hypothetical protein
MRILPTRVHGVLDYTVGLFLIGAPWLLGFDYGGAETVVFVIFGVTAIFYSLFTDYELGVARMLNMRIHLLLDIAAGLFLAASPWLFGFADDVMIPHIVFGAFSVLVALSSETTAGRAVRHSRHHRHAH